MSDFPQLRVRTGFSFKGAYGRIDQVLARVKETGATAMGMVDSTTWGHCKFEQAAKKAEIQPMFGLEFPVIGLDDEFKPKAWMLAANTRAFYMASSQSAQGKGIDLSDILRLRGVITFAGGCASLDVNAAFDYVDINPASYTAAAISIDYARKYKLPMVITSYNDMPSDADKSNAYAWEVRESVGPRSIMMIDDIRARLGNMLTHMEWADAIGNAYHIAEKLKGVELAKAPMIHLEGDLELLCRAGMNWRLASGYLSAWNDTYEARLRMELEMIRSKGFDSYFLMVADLVQFAKEHMLVGPGRGSAAGSLVCYLMRITEVDPIKHDLLFQRFIDVSRADWPDIDIDFPDGKRDMVFDYLKKKYGAGHIARVGNLSQLQPKSIFPQVRKKFGISIDDTMMLRRQLSTFKQGDELYGHSIEDTIKQTSGGQAFAEKHPAATRCMAALELHPSHTSVHAGGVLVCNDLIDEYCTVNGDGVACIDKGDAEYLNLLKVDALGLRTLGILEDAGVMSREELYKLHLDDQSVLDILNEDRVSGIFQFEGDAVRGVTRQVKVNRFGQIDHLTALARPGPLQSGMGSHYTKRASGKSNVVYDVPELAPILDDTYGVFLYQEQVMAVCKDLGGFDWAKVSSVRKAMAKSKGAEFINQWLPDFLRGTSERGIPVKAATSLWEAMVTFGGYGFNRAHSCSYAIVTYWTMYLKRYHPLHFAAACLRSAKDDAQVIAILRELAKEGVSYTALDPDFSELNWRVADGRLIGGILNAVGFGPVKALSYVQARAAGTLTDKQRETLAKAKVKYADINEAHTLFGHFYRNPELAGVTSGMPIYNIKKVKNDDTALVIAKLVKKTLLDENEPRRIKDRVARGKPGKYEGDSVFVDFYMGDDSTDSPFRFRVRPEFYEAIGRKHFEEAPVGSWFLIKGRKLADIDMFIVKKMKRLDI
jgi:DNA polymerase III alpha subunit